MKALVRYVMHHRWATQLKRSMPVAEEERTHPSVVVIEQERRVRYEEGHVSVLSDKSYGRNLGAVALAYRRARRKRNQDFVNRR